jgi:cytochrome c oxidase cbb3-type subunit 2
MSEKKNDIYSKAVLFSIVAAVVVLIGTIATVFVPMFTKGMNPKLENLKPYTALELAGRDIYQREGCVNCHTQTVRPLKADVLRYGDYSRAGEFYYDRPFLWGSKRTGPDLARVGEKYPDEWHEQHFTNPRAFFPKSNMPKYGWLTEEKLNPEQIKSHMDALSFPYTEEEIKGLANNTEMEALIAYIQVLGTAIEKTPVIEVDESMIEEANPLEGDKEALARGLKLYKNNCAGCHGQEAEGNIGSSLKEYVEGDPGVVNTYLAIANGIEGAMPAFVNIFSKEEIWSIVTYVHSLVPPPDPEPQPEPEPASESGTSKTGETPDS